MSNPNRRFARFIPAHPAPGGALDCAGATSGVQLVFQPSRKRGVLSMM
jgi:hypothetical protein